MLYDEPSHSYTINGKPLISVTTLIKKCTQPFNSLAQAPISAKKHGVSVEEMLRQWKENSEKALDKGSRVHKYIENFRVGGPLVDLMKVNKRLPEMDAFDKLWSSIVDHNPKFEFRELIVADEEWGIAGIIDAVLHLDRAGRLIWDWKTGKLDDKSFGMMRSPFDDIGDSKFNRYSLQVSLYRLILERNAPRIAPSGACIAHLRSDGEPHLIQALDFRSKWEKMLKNGMPKQFAGDSNVHANLDSIGDHLSNMNYNYFLRANHSVLSRFLDILESTGSAIKSILSDSDDSDIE